MPASRLLFLIVGAGGYVAWLITFFSTTFLGVHHDEHAASKSDASRQQEIILLDTIHKLQGENNDLKRAIARQLAPNHTPSTRLCAPCSCLTTRDLSTSISEARAIVQTSQTSIAAPKQCGRPGTKCGLNTTLGSSLDRGRDTQDAFKRNGLLFLRIQKTAGTTFEQVLKSECTTSGVTCGSYWHLERNMIARNSKGRVLVTWLRDPVERVASEWGYIRNAPGYQWQQPQWDFAPELQSLLHLWRQPPEGGEPMGSLADFVGLPGNPANNRQVLYLLGFDRPDIFDCDHIRAFGGTWDRWQSFFSEGGTSPGHALSNVITCGMPPSKLLDLAKHRLAEEIHYFGLAECFNASLAVMAPQLGWNLTRTLHVASVRHRADGGDLAATGPAVPWRHRLGAEEIKAIESANALDLELYTFAKKLLQQRIIEAKVSERCS